MGSDEMIEFVESNYDDLVEEFILSANVKANWENFIADRYKEHCADLIDHAKEQNPA